MTDQTFSNRQAMADMAEIRRIAEQLEEQRGKNRILDHDMRVMLRIIQWLGDAKKKNPLRPMGPALAQARLALRASKLATRSIGRARQYVFDLMVAPTDPITVREALQQRIAAGDQQAAEALHVFEAWAPDQLDQRLVPRRVAKA